MINVGELKSQREFIEVAIEIDADAILISTVEQEKKVNCQKFKQECSGLGLENILLYADGNLVVDN